MSKVSIFVCNFDGGAIPIEFNLGGPDASMGLADVQTGIEEACRCLGRPVPESPHLRLVDRDLGTCTLAELFEEDHCTPSPSHRGRTVLYWVDFLDGTAQGAIMKRKEQEEADRRTRQAEIDAERAKEASRLAELERERQRQKDTDLLPPREESEQFPSSAELPSYVPTQRTDLGSTYKPTVFGSSVKKPLPEHKEMDVAFAEMRRTLLTGWKLRKVGRKAPHKIEERILKSNPNYTNISIDGGRKRTFQPSDVSSVKRGKDTPALQSLGADVSDDCCASLEFANLKTKSVSFICASADECATFATGMRQLCRLSDVGH